MTSLISVRVTTAYKVAVAVFSGKVISVEKSADENFLIVKFAVQDSWKGTGGTEVTVKTARDSAMCGYQFKDGKEYLVYAHGTAAELSVGNCSRTASVAEKSELKYLAKLKRNTALKNNNVHRTKKGRRQAVQARRIKYYDNNI